MRTKPKYKPAWLTEKVRRARPNGIPKTAVRAFLARNRRDLREYKGLTDSELGSMEADLPVEMPLWSILRHHQRVCAILGATYRKIAFFNDTGCLAGETEIETDQGPRRIDELEREGRPIRVLARTENGIELVDASCPFKKGPTGLFRVTFKSGREMLVTAKHRFLTDSGWMACENLLVGARLPLFERGLQQSNSIDTVTSITYKRFDVYYDLHVPVYENYIANDLCHHNTGKTLLAISLGRYFRRLKINGHSGVDRIIILVPIRSNKYEWAREIRKHSPRTKFQVLEGSTVNKWQQIEENPDALFFIETYGGFVHLLCRKVPSKKKDKQKMEPDPKLVRKFCKLFQGAVSDEGTVLGQRDNLPRRLIRQVVKAKEAVYFNLTGTPFGRDPSLVHSQMSLVDEGWTLGETLGLFRAAFFKSSENNWGGIDYTFDTTKDEMLHKFLAHQSVRYEVKQSDLPVMVHDTIEVALDASADVWLERAASAMKNARGDYQATKNAFLRMRQISSGFVGYKDDESGDKAEFEFDSNPKLEAMLQKVEEIDPRHKGIIFCDFQYSNQRIADALKKSGIGFLQLYGKTKNPESVLAKFDSDPDKQWLILSNAMAIGLNLQIAQYGFFYESPVSVIMRKQARRRFERQGSEHDTVFLWDMITLDTYDQRILDFHEQGKSLFDAIMNGEVKL